MKTIHEVLGISKQCHYKWQRRNEAKSEKVDWVLSSVEQVRKLHPRMGLKKIYKMLLPDWIGRDRFITIGMELGLGIRIPKSYQRTTYSHKSSHFGNLTTDLEIYGINQVWVSDITYYRIGERYYYITMISDVYSRRILGYSVYSTLEAESNCIALRMALKIRAGMDLNGLIHHSDKGGQYYSNKYLKIESEHGISVSMCDSVYENTHIERINGTVKNEYLRARDIKNMKELKSEMQKTVRIYNEERPHWSLGLMTPCAYEKHIETIPSEEREVLVMYSEQKKKFVNKNYFINFGKPLDGQDKRKINYKICLFRNPKSDPRTLYWAVS